MNEVAVYEPGAAVAPIRPAPQLPVPAMNDIDSWTQIMSKVIMLANEIYDTPFVPDGLRGSAAAVSAAILTGREMGLGPMTSLANIDVIRGKPTQKPLLMRAMILSQGHKWEDVENNDTRAVVRGCRKGESTWTTVTFTADQARKAGLELGKYPADKLYARASSRLAKHRFADVIMGMASSDDAEDGVDAEVGVDTATGEVTSGTTPAALEAARPKTAQRRTRQSATPTGASPAAGSAQDSQSPQTPAPANGQTAPSGDAGLPPLPGEEDVDPTTSGASSSAHAPASGSPTGTGGQSPSTPGGSAPDETDYDTPGTVATPQITAIWTVLSMVYQFGKDERDQARMVCGQIINRDLESTRNLSRNEAKGILDTLGHWQHQAEAQGEDTRAYLIQMLAAAEEARHAGE